MSDLLNIKDLHVSVAEKKYFTELTLQLAAARHTS